MLKPTYMHMYVVRIKSRFNFPQPPFLNAATLEPLENATHADNKNARRIFDFLGTHGEDELPTNFYELCMITEEEQLAPRFKRPAVFLEGSPRHIRANPSAAHVINVWEADIDSQFILSPYAATSVL